MGSMSGPTAASHTTDPALVVQKYLKDFWDLAVRRKWLILSFVILGIVIGGTLAWLKVDMYRSETVILIEQQKIPEKYVSSVVGGSTADRVSTMTQQVLSRTSLLKIIEEFHLYSDEIKARGYEGVIEALRTNIKIETKGSGGQIEAFNISFAHRDPKTAMKVTARLASQYIDENIRIREQFIEGAMEFLDQELISAKEALDQKEKALSEYRMKYVGELPAQLEANFRTLDRLQLEKTRIQESMNSINTRLDLLEKTILDYEANPGMVAKTKGSLLSGKTDPLSQRLYELNRELAKLSSEYKESYPDIISLKKQIKDAEQELANRPMVRGGGQVPSDPYLAELLNTKKELNSQLPALKSQLAEVSKNMKNLEKRLEDTPHHEQALLALERDYDNIQRHYQRLHENRINARISENLDKRQKGERFRILDPANLPTKPEGKPRELIAAAGFILGTGLGFGLAFLLDLLWPTFRRSEEVEMSLGLATLATIPSFKMAYGKSMKMVANELEAQSGANGKHLALSQCVDSLLTSKGSDTDTEGHDGGVSEDRPKTSHEAFLPQLNLVAKWRPHSIVAEQYRVAATRLDLLDPVASNQVVLITSAMKGEGKTSTSANIAYTLARDLDEPTLIIDCDFKCPNLHRVLGLNQAPGVAEYFSGAQGLLEPCLQKIPDLPLWCMSVGDVGRYPVPLAKLQNLSSMLEMMTSRYRFIILDGPPVLPLADVNVLSGLAHVVLVVVRSGVTPKDAVQKAVEMIQHTGPTRLVLTDAWTQGVPYYVRQRYIIPYSSASKS
ncbi:polysaccharide biosynthesis tyrosine autokinase [Candidatus Nitrospira allomarina]|uniref:non-specific protein-tyrosine kinase n=1 Tax=Candidatus Nitrospira allomarina TaxID=3020900 RepID=A0AA96GDH0_9BACT|nr:AAA family ATPase [Candidatus Nitrospira allomarina]WNM57950.1 GNVR domain-containing protein [Candidatus Nitrospira allomarina]